MTIHIPSALRSYTKQQGEVQVEGATLADALAALDRRFSGIRFRIITEQDTIRPHIRIFVNDVQFQDLSAPLKKADSVYIVCALSGG
ncbi:MAG: MoaD/ThiS family protein [Nitrospira sp.]